MRILLGTPRQRCCHGSGQWAWRMDSEGERRPGGNQQCFGGHSRARTRPSAQGNTSVLTLVAHESSFGSTNIKHIGYREIKGIHVFQCINKRSFKDCYGKVVGDLVDAVAGESRAWPRIFTVIFSF